MDYNTVLSSVGSSEYTTLAEHHPKAVSIEKHEDFYIEPDFNSIKYDPNQKLILFSAPGATGKSALARHISIQKHALLWDLSMEPIASHSFTGMLVESLGPFMFSKFVEGLNNGQAVLIIDALDEAEMISGRVAVETLLEDIRSIASGAESPNIILCARTETSHFISEYYSNAETYLPFSQYEVSFFEKSNAVKFILQRIATKYPDKAITPVTYDWIEAQFNQIKNLLNNDSEAERSFLGYAPVLEALSLFYSEGTNDITLIQQTSNSENGTSIFNDVMENILKREQKKVINGFKERCQKDYPDFKQWDVVYSIEEQIKRLALFLVFDSTNYLDYKLESLPRELSAEYGEQIQGFLKDHPFVRIRDNGGDITADFTGPAFRDYVLSKLMTLPDSNDYDLYSQEYFQAHNKNAKVPSQLFFDFYHYFSPNQMKKEHFSYLYDAFKAKAQTGTKTGLSIEQIDSSFNVAFSLQKETYSKTFEFDMLQSQAPLLITQLNNAYIDIREDIVLGRRDEDAIISNSTIKCRKLLLNTHYIVLNSHGNESLLISCDAGIDNSKCPNAKFEIRIDRPEQLRISTPDVRNWYRLQQYAYELENEHDLDTIRFENSVKTILKHFRKHKKDTPGRHYEFIKNVIVGNSSVKNSILNFFIDQGIVFKDSKDPKQYKLDIAKLEKLGVNWGQLSQNSTPSMSKVFESYKQWAADNN